MKDQSHKDEMSAAIRGDFQRLRDRGVAATLAPNDDDPSDTVREEPADVSAAPLAAQETLPEHSEAVVAFEAEPVVGVSATPAESASEPPGDAGDEPRDEEQPGFFARLLGR